MTDNEIITALERCGQHRECCYCNSVEECGNKRVLTASTLDLINRQKAEIERLNVELVGMRGACESYKMHYDNAQAEIERLKKDKHIIKDGVLELVPRTDIEEIKSEAIKEFADKVNPIIEQIIEIMFDGDKSDCMIENCDKPSSIPCVSRICIDENKEFWKSKIYNLVKETEGEQK